MKKSSRQLLIPRIKRFSVHKRGVVVIPNMVSGFRLSNARFWDEVSVHDYISEHRAGIALHQEVRRKEEKNNAADKHDKIAPASPPKKTPT